MREHQVVAASPRLYLVPVPESRRRRPAGRMRVLWRRMSRPVVLMLVTVVMVLSGGIGATSVSPASAAFIDLDVFCVPMVVYEVTGLQQWPGGLNGLTPATALSSTASTGTSALNDPLGTGVKTDYPTGRAVTAYEWWGTAGQTWVGNNISDLKPVADCGMTSIGWMALSAVANLLWMFVVMMASIAIMIFTLTTAPNFLNALFAPVGTILNSMLDTLYMPFLIPMVVLAALWIAYTGLVKKRSSESVQGVLWVVAAACVSIAFLQSPMWFVDRLNGAIGMVQSATIDAVSQAGALALPGGANKTETLCYAGDPKNTAEYTVTLGSTLTSAGKPVSVMDPSLTQKNAYMASISNRTMQCLMWQIFLYEPWKAGQLGDLANVPVTGTDGHTFPLLVDGEASADTVTIPPVTINGRSLGAAQEYSAALVYMNARVANHNDVTTMEEGTPDPPVAVDSEHPSKAQTINAFASWLKQTYTDPVDQGTLASDAPGIAGVSNFVGKNGSNQILMALLAFVAVLFGAIPIIVMSTKLLFYQLMTIIMLLLSPLYLIIGIHPGFGRGIALGWLEYIVNLSIKRIGVTFLLAIMMLVFQIVITS